jgi:hypothetical protein
MCSMVSPAERTSKWTLGLLAEKREREKRERERREREREERGLCLLARWLFPHSETDERRRVNEKHTFSACYVSYRQKEAALTTATTTTTYTIKMGKSVIRMIELEKEGRRCNSRRKKKKSIAQKNNLILSPSNCEVSNISGVYPKSILPDQMYTWNILDIITLILYKQFFFDLYKSFLWMFFDCRGKKIGNRIFVCRAKKS